MPGGMGRGSAPTPIKRKKIVTGEECYKWHFFRRISLPNWKTIFTAVFQPICIYTETETGKRALSVTEEAEIPPVEN